MHVLLVVKTTGCIMRNQTHEYRCLITEMLNHFVRAKLSCSEAYYNLKRIILKQVIRLCVRDSETDSTCNCYS
jgi:hypothetical protein